MKLISHFFCFLILLTTAQAVTAKNLEIDQLCALVDGAILPFLQCNTNEIATNKSSGFNLVIIENGAFQNILSKKYTAFSKCFRFEAEDAIFWRAGTKMQAEGYIDKATGQYVCVDRFEIVSTKKNKCLVKWSYGYASLGGFTKIVTLVLKDNKWVVVDVKLETVS